MSATAAEAEDLLSSYERIIEERLEEGLRAIQHTANTLMHEIAAEVWRTAGGDKDEVQETILEALTRDQTVRSLLAHSDERFQALSVRASRLEDGMQLLADSMRAAKEQLSRSIDELQELQAAPGSIGEVRMQLAEVTRQIALAFETLAERDRTIVETVDERVREHGQLVTQETARISAAMQEYVQQGVAAIGQLSGNIEAQVQALANAGGQLVPIVSDAVEEQMRQLGEQLMLMNDRIGIEGRDQVAAIHQLESRTYDRIMGIARLVRSDSETLRDQLVAVAAEQDEKLGAVMDAKLDKVSDALTAATRWMVEELTHRMSESLRREVDRLDVSMAETFQRELQRNTTEVADRTSAAVDVAIRGRLDDVLARMHDTMSAMERTRDELERSRTSTEESMTQTVESRMGALAKLVRSDNETLAEQIVADQEASKQALRAMKELQASLPVEVIERVERRFESLAESIQKSNELLSRRIDRMAATIGERHEDDMKVVIDRMGDAMHALASLGRPGSTGRPPDRIEVD